MSLTSKLHTIRDKPSQVANDKILCDLYYPPTNALVENLIAAAPSILHAEPVLAVTDVVQTVKYYHEVLCFPDHWTWGDPPNHGGVSWNGCAFLQFSLQPSAGSIVHHESVWLRVKGIDSLYDLHLSNKVEVVTPLVTRPWNFREYIIKDINGYYITFAEPYKQKQPTQEYPQNILLSEKRPTIDDVVRLARLVGWQPSTNSAIESQLKIACIQSLQKMKRKKLLPQLFY